MQIAGLTASLPSAVSPSEGSILREGQAGLEEVVGVAPFGQGLHHGCKCRARAVCAGCSVEDDGDRFGEIDHATAE